MTLCDFAKIRSYVRNNIPDSDCSISIDMETIYIRFFENKQRHTYAVDLNHFKCVESIIWGIEETLIESGHDNIVKNIRANKIIEDILQ